MKLTKKQQRELEDIKANIPSWCTFEPVTDEDVAKYFAWSDRGIPHGEIVTQQPWSGFKALYYGKRYRDAMRDLDEVDSLWERQIGEEDVQ